MGELCKTYGKHIRSTRTKTRSSSSTSVPISIRDRSIGRVKFPIFKVVGWMPKRGPNGTRL